MKYEEMDAELEKIPAKQDEEIEQSLADYRQISSKLHQVDKHVIAV